MMYETAGTRMKGIISTGFITIGRPKIRGSLILKIANGTDGPMIWRCELFLVKMMHSSMLRVLPVPPMVHQIL
ncbi:hypothetical protein D3C75_719090 [compost metagenome]